MQFITSVLALSLAAFASAQSTTVSTGPTTTYALTPQQTCLATCKAGDVNCQAACIGAAHPNSSQVSQTNECAAKCVQGDGSTSQTNLYAQCISACIASYYPTTQTVAAAVSSGSTIATVKASGTGSAASSGAVATGTASGSASGTASGSAALATSSKAAAANTTPFVGGLAGLLIAALAL